MQVSRYWSIILVVLILGLGLSACSSSPTPSNPAVVTASENSAVTSSTTTLPATSLPTSIPAQVTTLPPAPTNIPTVTPVSTVAGQNSTTPTGLSTASATPAPSGLASTSPYPGKIVYDTGDNQIFLVNPDGSERKKIAEGSWPIFSPDGKRLAFLTRTPAPNVLESKTVIISMKLDGTDRQELCSTSANADVRLVRWSSLGRFIVLTATQQDGPGSAYLCNVADKTLNRGIETTQGHVAGLYDWSPDGNYAVWQAGQGLSFQLYYGDPDKGGNGAVLLNSGADYRVTSEINRFEYYTTARISPDGTTLAVAGSSLFFLSVPGHHSPLEGKVYRGGQPLRLAWSPDGRALVLLSLVPSAAKPVPTISIQDISGGGIPGKSFELSENVGHSVDWTRQ